MYIALKVIFIRNSESKNVWHDYFFGTDQSMKNVTCWPLKRAVAESDYRI